MGGKNSLIYGVLLVNLGLYAYMLKSFPPIYIMIYLLVIYTFYGATDIMQALQAKKINDRSWKIKFATGVVNLSIGIVAIVLGLTREDVFATIYIYALGLAYSGVMRIVNAFRRTAITYIQ